jgi:hypothetical protein
MHHQPAGGAQRKPADDERASVAGDDRRFADRSVQRKHLVISIFRDNDAGARDPEGCRDV